MIDEADRLLGQSYHNWLEKIFQAAYRTHNDASSDWYVALGLYLENNNDNFLFEAQASWKA